MELSQQEVDEILHLTKNLRHLALGFTAPQFEGYYPEWSAVHNAAEAIENLISRKL